MQRHHKLWVQGHPKQFECNDAPKALTVEMLQWTWAHSKDPINQDTPKGHGCWDTPSVGDAGMPLQLQGQGLCKGPGCSDTPTALGAEVSHQATTARWHQVALTSWSHKPPVSPISLWDEPLSPPLLPLGTLVGKAALQP